MRPEPTAPSPATAFAGLARRRGARLSSRMVAMSVGLLLALQAVILVAVQGSVERNARQQTLENLDIGERVWSRLVTQRAEKLGQGATVLAADYGFRSAVASDDRETIVSALDNHGARIGASLAALLDLRFAPQAVGGEAPDALLPALGRLAPQLAERGHAVALVGARPVQFVMVPLRAPQPIGWVVMGFDFDGRLIDDLRSVTGLHAALRVEAGSDPARVVQTSMPIDHPLHARLSDPRLTDIPLHDWALQSLVLAPGEFGRVSLVLVGSVADAQGAYADLQQFLLLATLGGLALFALGSHWSARRITQPLRSLADASERFGQGDFSTPVRHVERPDEIGDLARAYEHMRHSIAASEQEIRQLAYWDRLTGLPNRVQFRDVVLSTIKGRGRPCSSLCVVMIDLDRFKHVNDVLGYDSGDRLLKGVADRLNQVVRDGDVVTRLGGDEFALLLPGADGLMGAAVAQRITSAFERPLSLDDQTVDLSGAMGIACWPEHAGDVDTLLSRAEVAMYAAKRRSSGALLYDSSLDQASAQTLSLLTELRQAVEQGELRLFLQPKVGVEDRSLSGAEALVRWQHPVRGLVPPMQFIPFAEQTGFVRRLTLWIFEQAAMQQARLAELGVSRVSVNLSTRDLLDLELPQKLDALLARHGARAEGFCLEITESAIMDDPERAEATINRLAQRGFKLSIDDFGTGYSSLAYLKHLPVDELKIDKSFVMGMAENDGDAKIVRSTIDLAHNLGLSVVAEGVENGAILDTLYRLGCDEAQGYHLSRPLPAADFAAWAEAWRARTEVAVTPGTLRAPSALH